MDCRKTLVIGPRTYKDILDGKKVRKHEDGGDFFEDYWTDSGSESSSIYSNVFSKKKMSKSEITSTQTESPSIAATQDTPAKNTRHCSRQTISTDSPAKNTRLCSRQTISTDSPAKNTRLCGRQTISTDMDSVFPTESSHKSTACDSPCKIGTYSLTKGTRISTRSIASQFTTMEEKQDSENSFLSNSVTSNSKTPNKNLDSVLADLAKDAAILSKTNDKLNSPESISSISCTSEIPKQNLRNSTRQIMCSSINLLSQTKILDHKSPDATEAHVERKDASVPEIVNVSNSVTDTNLLAEDTSGTETVFQPNNDKYSKSLFLTKMSLIPSQAAEFLKQSPKNSVRVLRSYKPVDVNKHLEQFDEYDAKIMQMIQGHSNSNSSHVSSVKKPTVKIKQTNSTTDPKICTRSVSRATSRHKKANNDLPNKTYISEPVVRSNNSKDNFEPLSEEQNVNDDTLPIIPDEHLLDKNSPILEAMQNKSLASKNNKNVSELKKNKHVSSQSNGVSPDKFLKNTPSKAKKKEITETHQDKNLIYINQPKTSNQISRHEVPPIDTLSQNNFSEDKEASSKHVLGSDEEFNSADDNSELISQTFTTKNKMSLAYIHKRIENHGINNSKCKRSIKKPKSRLNEINNVTYNCDIGNLKLPSENTINKCSPKKRRITDHNENNTFASDLSEHDLNNQNAQNEKSTDHELENNVCVPGFENIDTNVSNKNAEYNSTRINRLLSNDALISNNSFNTDVPEIDDFGTSMPKFAKKQNHRVKKTVRDTNRTDKQNSTKPKDQPENTDVHTSMQKSTKKQKLNKNEQGFENIDTNVSNEDAEYNSTGINRLLSNDALISNNSFNTDVPEIDDLGTSMAKFAKKQNHRVKKAVRDTNRADKQNSTKRKDQPKNTDVHTSMQKSTKRQKLTKNKSEQGAYKVNKQSKQSENDNVRRSNRKKYKPLASWKNERLLYGFKDGEVEILGLDPGSIGLDHIAETLEQKQYFKNSIPKKSSKIIKPKKAKIVDPILQKEVRIDLYKKFDLIPWHVPPDGKSSKKPDYAYRIKKLIETPKNSFGYIEIAVGKEKPPQYIPEEDISLTIFRGKVEIVIQGNSYTLCTKDAFLVPRGSAYSLKNIGNASALISFVVGRFKITDSL